MRIMILADDCNPNWPSLPIVAYKAARAIAEAAEVVVITHVRNRENIQKAGFGKAQVRYVDSEYIARPMFKFARLLRGGTDSAWTTAVAMSYPSYLAFEWEVWKAFGSELRAGAFDIVHRLTPMSPTLPSPMAAWSPIPFVLGPLNGGLKWPRAFGEELAREREWLSYIRAAYRALPYQKSTYRRSAAILAAFQHTIDDLPKAAQARAINFPEVGVDPDIFHQTSQRTVSKKKTILFVGRLVPCKMPQLVVKCFIQSRFLRAHNLVIVGDGPERPAIERLIGAHGLEKQVQLLGWKSQADVAALMRSSDIFAFPSIRELGAGVIVEAMACGLACVVVDYGAPGSLVNFGRGLKVSADTSEELTEKFARALEYLVEDDVAALHIGMAAREHVMRHFTWDAKAKKMLAVYDFAVGRTARPDFWGGYRPCPQRLEPSRPTIDRRTVVRDRDLSGYYRRGSRFDGRCRELNLQPVTCAADVLGG